MGGPTGWSGKAERPFRKGQEELGGPPKGLGGVGRLSWRVGEVWRPSWRARKGWEGLRGSLRWLKGEGRPLRRARRGQEALPDGWEG